MTTAPPTREELLMVAQGPQHLTRPASRSPRVVRTTTPSSSTSHSGSARIRSRGTSRATAKASKISNRLKPMCQECRMDQVLVKPPRMLGKPSNSTRPEETLTERLPSTQLPAMQAVSRPTRRPINLPSRAFSSAPRRTSKSTSGARVPTSHLSMFQRSFSNNCLLCPTRQRIHNLSRRGTRPETTMSSSHASTSSSK